MTEAPRIGRWQRALIIGMLIEAPLALLGATGCFGACRMTHFPMILPLYVLQLPSTIFVDWLGSVLPVTIEPAWLALTVYFGLVFILQSTLIAALYRMSSSE